MIDILLPLSTMAVFGLAGSLHCAAMCSAIVGCCSHKTWHFFLSRSLSYTILGLLCGFLGTYFINSIIHIPSYSLSLLVASLYILQVILLYKPNLFNFPIVLFFIQKSSQYFLRYSPFSRSATFGILTAILPCGFLYSALLISASAANPYLSAASMFIFSLVTSPVLLFSNNFINLLFKKYYFLRKTILSTLLITIAFLVLIRGGVIHFEHPTGGCH